MTNSSKASEIKNISDISPQRTEMANKRIRKWPWES